MNKFPPLKSLPVFCEVARHLSFSKAAKSLCLTDSAVSQSVRSLEDFLGAKLFIRDGHTIRLTQEGESYLNSIRPSLNTISKATEKLLTQSTGNSLSINLLSSFMTRWVISHLPEFQEKYPSYELRISSEWREVDFDYEPVDLAVYYGDGDWPNLSVTKLFDEELVLLRSPNLDEIITLENIEKPFLYVTKKLRRDNLSIWFDRKNLPEPDESKRVYFQNTLQSLQAAKEGMGIIAVNKLFASSDIESGHLIEVPNTSLKTGRAYYLVCREKDENTGKIRDFSAWMQSEVAKVVKIDS